MQRYAFFPGLLLVVAVVLAVEPVSAGERETGRYAASGWPDRIVLSPGADPAREMAVAFRTDEDQRSSEAELALGADGPDFEESALRYSGEAVSFESENGEAVYHRIRFEDLLPDTSYLYRLRGAEGWSEWFQFRTAADAFQPFRFLYFGDVQNDVLSRASRVIRQAFHATADPALALHAGDLVNLHEESRHDDEWGAWAAAGGHHYASVPQLPVAGNHEHPLQEEERKLSPHWPLQFALPENGAKGLETTTYAVDYQGVRFIVLDGTAALKPGGLDAQSAWLDAVLSDGEPRWTIVATHQPLFGCSREDQTAEFAERWKTLFNAGGVDLVLQGHDHCYARFGPMAAEDDEAGPVYLVSVAGPKMYPASPAVTERAEKVGEDLQLYQVIDVEAQSLQVRSFTASGRLFDAFTIESDPLRSK